MNGASDHLNHTTANNNNSSTANNNLSVASGSNGGGSAAANGAGGTAAANANGPGGGGGGGGGGANGSGLPVKTERLSPTANNASNANTPDNNSSSSRSATPSLSYPGTPPGGVQERGASPASFPAGHLKHMEQMMTRNYSDFMRSLAAKYNNANPNERTCVDSYFSTSARNGYPMSLESRFNPFKTGPTPLVSLMAPAPPTLPASIHKGGGVGVGVGVGSTGPGAGVGVGGGGGSSTGSNSGSGAAGSSAFSAASKETSADKKTVAAAAAAAAAAAVVSAASATSGVDAQQALYNFSPAAFGASAAANPGLFPPMIDMRSTQALLGLVRTANAHNASQLETYLKTSGKRPSPSESTPLDLSSASVPQYGKKARSFKAPGVSDAIFKSESVMNIPMMDALRNTKDRLGAKRLGSVSPKPLTRCVANSGGSSAGSSPRLGAPATVTSQHLYGRNLPCLSTCTAGGERGCGTTADAQAVTHWTVEDVCGFVASIDICAEYVQNFRDQCIDGSSLPLLTEEHLTSTLAMKLGPALKLRSLLARRLGHCAICMHCVHCHGPGSQPPPGAATPVSPAQTPPALSALGRPSSTGV